MSCTRYCPSQTWPGAACRHGIGCWAAEPLTALVQLPEPAICRSNCLWGHTLSDLHTSASVCCSHGPGLLPVGDWALLLAAGLVQSWLLALPRIVFPALLDYMRAPALVVTVCLGNKIISQARLRGRHGRRMGHSTCIQ